MCVCVVFCNLHSLLAGSNEELVQMWDGAE